MSDHSREYPKYVYKGVAVEENGIIVNSVDEEKEANKKGYKDVVAGFIVKPEEKKGVKTTPIDTVSEDSKDIGTVEVAEEKPTKKKPGRPRKNK